MVQVHWFYHLCFQKSKHLFLYEFVGASYQQEAVQNWVFLFISKMTKANKVDSCQAGKNIYNYI